MSYEGAFVYRDRFNEIYEFQEVSTDFDVGFGRRGETGRFGAIFNFLSVKSDTSGETLSPVTKMRSLLWALSLVMTAGTSSRMPMKAGRTSLW